MAASHLTHYQQLGVPPSASHDQIRAAYRALARLHHPDTQPQSDPAAVERSRRAMSGLNQAWAVLGDPARRRAYDATLGLAPLPRPAPPAGGWEPLDDADEDLDPELLDDRPYGDPPPRRPADSMVITPVLLVLAAVALFFFSTMVQSPGLRTAAILMLPVSGLGFVVAPLFVMVRGRSRPRD